MMPEFMRPILNAMPLTYLGDSLRQIMVGALAPHSHYVNLAVLGGWFLVCLIGAVRFFRWESSIQAPFAETCSIRTPPRLPGTGSLFVRVVDW
jgi:ABC-type polysaccharide/polyol phosphate export permease